MAKHGQARHCERGTERLHVFDWRSTTAGQSSNAGIQKSVEVYGSEV